MTRPLNSKYVICPEYEDVMRWFYKPMLVDKYST